MKKNIAMQSVLFAVICILIAGMGCSKNPSTPKPTNPPPVLVSPSNGSAGQPTPVTLTWIAATGAVSYGLQVSMTSVFSSTVSSQSGVLGTSATVSSLNGNTVYYWEANATSSAGTSAWSGVWSFTTATLPPLKLLQPTGGETYHVGDTVQIKWQVNSTNVSSVLVYLYHDSLATLLLPHSYPPDTTTYAWIVVGSQVSNHCYIQLREYFDNVPRDSSGIFTITP